MLREEEPEAGSHLHVERASHRESMSRQLSCRRTVAGRSVPMRMTLAADPGGWLPEPARRSGADGWIVALAAGPLQRPVICRVGAVWRVGDATWRTISWTPQGERHEVVAAEKLLPTFNGELGLRAENDEIVLTLQGTYQPPAGPIGDVLDSAALQHVAQASANRFLDSIARNLLEGGSATPGGSGSA